MCIASWPRQLLAAALELDEHADLVRRRVRVGVHDLALAGLVALRADDDDVLAQLARNGDAVVLQRLDRLRDRRRHGLEHPLRERLELLVLRDRLGLAADGDHRADAVLDPVADEALGRRAAGTLRHLRHPPLAEERARGLEVAARLLERALAVHHRGAR